MLRYVLLVTGPAYGTQQSSTALLFAQALLSSGHRLDSVFFYREGVANGNVLTSPASDECDLVREWQHLAEMSGAQLNVCISAALRRGVVDEQTAQYQRLSIGNLQPGFMLSGLGAFAEAVMKCDRLIQF